MLSRMSKSAKMLMFNIFYTEFLLCTKLSSISMLECKS